MPGTEVASILHRETIAVIVGKRTFERGEQCFAAGRVIDVSATRGELRGRVRPQEARRAPYTVRVWVRDEGIAYQCTCPIGEQQQFCKHTVAVTLAHLDREQRAAADALLVLHARLTAIGAPALIDRLIARARDDAELLATLRAITERDERS